MTERNTTRRRFLKASAATVATAAVPATATAAESQWTVAETPTGNTLYDVEYAADGAYAVGAGGVALKRTAKGWTKIFDGGVTGNGNSLYGADVTDDGKRLWFVGSSGAVGAYDVETGTLYNHSKPVGSTNNFNDVSVMGQAGEANVYVAGDSGKIYYSFENGASQTWDYVTPGSGASLSAIDFHDAKSGHVVDTNQKVFQTTDGVSYTDIGITDANVNFYGVDSDATDDVRVSGGGGTVFHWDGANWTPTDLGDAGLKDIEVTTDDSEGLTVGGGGKVFDKTGLKWAQDATPTGQNLKAVVRGDVDVAFGAGGTVVEK
ncbi:twin-arginine translocation signal domain-containing protein [Halorussus gelatinilyticus]|uniref:Twin-arginine translocation signal domain-containing protein n=1 Tax=Halorussus gelatinilyticus TaxID=2937524 RepID=A0A8U0IJM4_9EURY|nr:twin-arginine translocation signal domain-containing protein [Halorussus gelatinilyticus]UPW01327.1 twin-arginine translocation signal domain-containing protein [Halorussus gelatinilyticus]